MAITQGTILLIVYALLALVALRALFSGGYPVAVTAIFILALLLRVFMAGDLYLHDWDERFHAVIAKHIWSSPFAPRLYTDGVLDYDFARWSESDLWLSKPFLPFWLLGASIALFGNNLVGLRLPSVLIGLASVWFTLRMATELFGRKPGLIAAFLHAIHGMTLEMGGGLVSSDHVDTLFTFFFQVSLYAYIRSWRNNSRGWLVLAGFLIGLAFLTKWIMAFFALAVIGVVHLRVAKTRRAYLRDYALILLPFGLTVAPWLLYLFKRFPEETTLIFRQFLGRTGESFEGHSGGLFFYPEDVMILFGAGIFLTLGWLCTVIYRKGKARHLLIGAWALVPLVLLSLLSTKRNTYLIMSAPAYFIATGLFIVWLLRQRGRKWITVATVVLLLGLPVQYSLERVKPYKARFASSVWWNNKMRRITWEQRLANSVKPGAMLVVQEEEKAFDIMFFHDGVLAYSRKLSPEEVDQFKSAGYYVASSGADAGAE